MMTDFWAGDLASSISGARAMSDSALASPDFAAWISGHDESASVSTNVGSYEIPFQRWMKFKEAFSPKFVVDALRAMPRAPRRCIDPFGGSGTTALTCSFLGIEAVTIEVNPFLSDLIEAKLAPPTSRSLTAAYAHVLARSRGLEAEADRLLLNLPKTFCEPGIEGRFVFWREAIVRILQIRVAIEACEGAERRLMRILLGSILVEASNVVVNGKGRRYRGAWERRRVGMYEVDSLFGAAVGRAARDLAAFGSRRRVPATLLRGDSRVELRKAGPVDAAIFSPPYPNSFDYTDVYNLELWVLGYVDGPASNRALRQSTIRSHVQVAFDQPKVSVSARAVATIARLSDVRARLWNSRIPEMVGGYFEDMEGVLRNLHALLSPGGRVVTIIGDSRYAGVHVNVALVLRELAEAIGFEYVSSQPIRSMRSSAQDGGSRDLVESCLVLQR